MNKKKFELQFDAKIELSDIKKQLGVLSASLDKLEIPANMTKNLEKAFKRALDQLADFETLSEKSAENLGDIKKVERAWDQVTASLDNISAILKTIDTSNLFSKDAKKNIESAGRALDNYIQKLEQAKKSSAYQVEEKKRDDSLKEERAAQDLLDKAKKKQMSAEAEFEAKKSSWGEEAQKRYAAEQAEIEDINKKLKDQLTLISDLEKKKDKLVSEGYMTKSGEVSAKAQEEVRKGSGNAKKVKEAERIATKLRTARGVRKDYEGELRSAKMRASGSIAIKEDYEKAERAVQETQEAVEQLTVRLQAAQEATKTFEQNMVNIAEGEAAAAWAELVQLLREITGLDLDGTAGDLEAIRQAIQKYKQDELEKAPGTVEKLKEEAEETKGPVKQVTKELEELGNTGKGLADATDEMDRLKQQVLDFFSITNAIDIFKRALSSAFDTVKELDTVMTEAAVVTDFSIGDMWSQMPQYSKNASDLGVATKDLYSATTLYYQQGLKGNDVMKVGAETMKMAKIASMDSAEATQAMTAALRGFNMEVSEMNAQKVNDVYSKLAAITAADTSQIATAMSKTASIAASANMEFETTAAFLAQIIETTQEAPETAGTALKTIVARFSEVKELQSQGLMSGVDAEGEAIDINKISTALRSVGISMDAFFAGQEGLDDVLLRLSQKWDTLDFTTQRYIATTAAGSRQQSRFIAMMSNYGRTMELVGAANDSAGASQEQYEKTLDSLDSKLAQLKNAWDQFTMGLANNEALKLGVDFLTKILETVNKVTDAISGGSGLVKSLTSLMTVISALKIGGKILGKNSSAGGLLGRIGGIAKDGSKQEYKRGVKDGKSYGEGWRAGLNEATQKIPAPEFSDPTGGNGPEDTAEKLNKVSMAAIGVGAAFGLLSIAFEKAGLEEAAGLVSTLAATFTSLGTIVPMIGKVLSTVGIQVSLSWGWVAVIGAAIAAVTAGIYLVAKSIKESSLEYRLEKAQEATENAKKAAEEAKSAYDNLLNTQGDYNSLQQSLKELTEGTIEWKAALFEANQQVLELLEKYPELRELNYLNTEGGRMTITDAGWEYMIQQALSQSQSASVARSGALLTEKNLAYQVENQGYGRIQDSLNIYYAQQASYEKAIKESKEKVAKYELSQDKHLQEERNTLSRLQGDLEAINLTIADYESELQNSVDLLEDYNQQAITYVQGMMGFIATETSQNGSYGKVSLGIAQASAQGAYNSIQKTQAHYMQLDPEQLDKQYRAFFGEPTEGMTDDQKANALASRSYGVALSKKVERVVSIIEEGSHSESEKNIMAAAISGDAFGLTLNELAKLKSMSFSEIATLYGYNTPDKLKDFYELTGLDGTMTQQNQMDYNSIYDDLIDSIGETNFWEYRGFLGNLSIETLGKLKKQFLNGNIDDSYKNQLIASFKRVMESEGLGAEEKGKLENTLTSTNWENPFERLEAMDTMFTMGIDEETIKQYWKAATAGVDGYIDSEEEALQLASRMQGKVKDMTELSDRLSSGTATANDLAMLEKIGIDTSEYTLTAEGWKATAEQTDEAITRLREYYLLQAQLEKQRLQINLELGEDSEEVKNVQKIIDMLKQPITTTYSIETNIDLLDRIKQAIVFDRQKEIDKLSEINDTIANSNSRIVSAMRESVESYRSQRENERMEESIAEKQSRLSYLKMDTSGANEMEIKRLEEEIAQEQESYTDKLIDEKISELERQNDVAQQQRAEQIALMEAQLAHDEKTGAFWDYINILMAEAYNSKTGELDKNSTLVGLMQDAEGYSGLSGTAQIQWFDTLVAAFKEGYKEALSETDTKPFVKPVLPSSSGTNPGFTMVQAFATGGLADFTGPAWLDGSKTNPEYVLSAQQTERFFELVDVLSSLKSGSSNATQNNRENNFDIDINVESISSDYDVEQVAIKVKDFIVNSSRYRNNNTL